MRALSKELVRHGLPRVHMLKHLRVNFLTKLRFDAHRASGRAGMPRLLPYDILPGRHWWDFKAL